MQTIIKLLYFQIKPKPIAKKPVPPHAPPSAPSHSTPRPPAPSGSRGGPSKDPKPPGGGASEAGGGALGGVEPVGADDYKTKLQLQRKMAREKALKEAEEEQKLKEQKM